MTSLEIYKIIFIIEIIVAEILMTYSRKKRKHFAIKGILSIMVLILLAIFIPIIEYDALNSCLLFFFLFACTIPFLCFVYQEKFINLLFTAFAAYTIQHFAYEITNVVMSLIFQARSPLLGMYAGEFTLGFNLETIFLALVWILCYFVSYVMLFKIFGKKLKKNQEMNVKSTALLFLLSAALLSDIIFNSVIIYGDFDFLSTLINQLSNALLCLILLYGQFTLIHSKELEGELEILNRLYLEQQKQYAMSKDNIDIINQKCHDMRYAIRKIGKDQKIDADVVLKMEQSISLYDSIVETGNEVLDTILTEKSLYCQEHNISLSVVCDGELINFIDNTSLYAFFGNAIDNSIEACNKISNMDNRFISIKVEKINNFVSISIKNSYQDDIQFDKDGMPISSKDNKAYHGFGTKSIKMFAERYNGDISFKARDNVFALGVLIPLPNTNL